MTLVLCIKIAEKINKSHFQNFKKKFSSGFLSSYYLNKESHKNVEISQLIALTLMHRLELSCPVNLLMSLRRLTRRESYMKNEAKLVKKPRRKVEYQEFLVLLRR